MFNPNQFEDLAKQLFSVLPNSMQDIEQDLQKKFKEVIQTACSNLDLITREEFDIQCKVLARTREKVEQLQIQIEHIINQQNSDKS